jgi:hypothetical protein
MIVPGFAIDGMFGRYRPLLQGLGWAAGAVLLVVLLSQIPVTHHIDIGADDSAYVQGFVVVDERTPERAAALAGSDGTARWSGSQSAMLFPQAGLPAELTIRLRGWRSTETPPQLTFLLNGERVLQQVATNGAWEEHQLRIDAGVLKASDFFLALRSDPPLLLPDGQPVGVLVDRVTYRVAGFPVLPYPTQLFYAAAVGGLAFGLLGRFGSIRVAALILGYGLLWLLLYRSQPPLIPYPLRWLPPATVFVLAAVLLVREGPALDRSVPLLLRWVAPLTFLFGWLGAILLTAEAHVTLARPGVENDFRVFATRETLAQVFQADGFYNLGYPLLLWLVRPIYADNAFLAGRLIAALSGAVLLGAGYVLARAILPPGPALLTLIFLGLNAFVVQYGLYVGSDMPFAALATTAVAALVWAVRREQWSPTLLFLAGVLGGMAYLMRHPGLLLWPWGLLLLALIYGWRRCGRAAVVFSTGFLLAIAPQVLVNLQQTGEPFFSQQAKNIWLAVYADTDWQRWEEVPNSVGLIELVRRDPGRMLYNWWNNLIAVMGSGAEDTSEFGRALQLRLLGWPANWLAVAGLLGWMPAVVRRLQARRTAPETVNGDRTAVIQAGLLLLILLMVVALSTAFLLQRFLLVLVPIYAVAAAWLLAKLPGSGRLLLAIGLALSVVLWGGFGIGANYVIALQPEEELEAIALVRRHVPPDAHIAARVAERLPLAKYSAIAHRVVDWPVGSDPQQTVTVADIAAARAAGATFLLWDDAGGPPPLADPVGVRLESGRRYTLYLIE